MHAKYLEKPLVIPALIITNSYQYLFYVSDCNVVPGTATVKNLHTSVFSTNQGCQCYFIIVTDIIFFYHLLYSQILRFSDSQFPDSQILRFSDSQFPHSQILSFYMCRDIYNTLAPWQTEKTLVCRFLTVAGRWHDGGSPWQPSIS